MYPQEVHAHVQTGPRPQVNGFVGWQVASDVDTASGSIRVDDSTSYGASLGATLRPGYAVELMWLWAPTQAQFSSNVLGLGSTMPADVDIHYIQIGGTRSIRRGIAEPFMGGSLGATIISRVR